MISIKIEQVNKLIKKSEKLFLGCTSEFWERGKLSPKFSKVG
jgi:hypothetical protein